MSTHPADDPLPPDDLHDGPLEIRTYRGAVVLTGPPGVALAMTVDAAEESAELLEDAARRARRGEPEDDA